jgi:RNA polymerase sigma-70 factor (ECF subfamily)
LDAFTASFLRSLAPQQRLTLLLVYGERFDTIDAGRVLDVPSETIGTRLVRITASLADRLSANEPAPASASVASLYPGGSGPS